MLPVDIRLSAHTNKLRFRPRSYSYLGKVPTLDVFEQPITDWDMVLKSAFDRIVGAIIFALSLIMICCICISATNAIVNDEKVPLELRTPTGGTMMDLNAKRQSQVLQKHGDLSDDLECGSRRCTNLIDFISVMPTFTIIFSLFFLIFIPSFYYRIFIPCYDCYDFEATIAHEVEPLGQVSFYVEFYK